MALALNNPRKVLEKRNQIKFTKFVKLGFISYKSYPNFFPVIGHLKVYNQDFFLFSFSLKPDETFVFNIQDAFYMEC